MDNSTPRRLRRFSASAFVLLLALSPAAPVLADTLVWDIDPSTPLPQDGTGTWLAGSVNFWDSTTGAPTTVGPVKGTDNITIGNTTGGGTVTISNNGALLNYSDATSGSTLTFAQNYTLAGAVAGDGIAIKGLIINAGVTANISAMITNGGLGNTTWTLGANSTLNLTGGGTFENMTLADSTANVAVNVTTGTYNTGGVAMGGGLNSSFTFTQSGGTLNGGFNFENNGGNASSLTTNTYNMSGGTLAMAGSAVSIGGQGTGGGSTGLATSTFNLQGGTITSTGGELRVGNDNGQGVFNVSSGSFTSTTDVTLARSGGGAGGSLAVTDQLNISGGSFTASQIQLSRTGQTFAAGSTATVNLTGGALYLGNSGQATGIVNTAYANLTSTVNLGGGILGAAGAWSTTMALNLTGTNGNTTIQAANSGGTAFAITLSGGLSGNGGFIKTGGGVLTLNATSTYLGSTIVSAGSLVVGASGSLGAGNVTVATAILTLGNSNAIGDAATLSATELSLITLGSGTEVIGSLFNTTTGSFVTAGTYTASQLDSMFFDNAAVFSGGSLQILTTAPEPGTWALLLVGGAVLAGTALRRRPSPLRA